PQFSPFLGLRYDPAVIPLNQVIAPPYDVIEPPERSRLAMRSSFNAVHLELPEADLRAGLDRYQVAARLLSEWRAEGMLLLEERPAFYLYRMTDPEGRRTLGVIGALTLPEDDEDGDVLPHEETLPKARSDRLDLITATAANLSPIWGLSLTSGMSSVLAPEGTAEIDVHDDDGVRHELWVAPETRAIAITDAVAASPVVIADGHHRYEVARAYRRQVRAERGEGPGGHDAVMALVVELSEDQLVVKPIHRVIAGVSGTELIEGLGEWFDVVRAGDGSDRIAGALGEAGSLALVTNDDAWLLTPRPEAYEAANSELDSSLVALAMQGFPKARTTHRHSWPEAIASIRSGEAEVAMLLRPPTVAQISEWAHERRRMPPKTTYFSPKPRTGMVIRPLDG
ncbi:MAG TPA: DUF1015 domain-containing protein, partial [Acidimicrobiales bacterium]|nr:DUF1015 domain-containing protein [Acidimicrobiales bacterium]